MIKSKNYRLRFNREAVRMLATVLLFSVLLVLLIIPIFIVAHRSSEETLKGEISSFFLSGMESLNERINNQRGISYSLRHSFDVMLITHRDNTQINKVNDKYVYNLVKSTQCYRNLDQWYAGIAVTFEKNDLFYTIPNVYNYGDTAFTSGSFAASNMDFSMWKRRLFDEKRSLWPSMDIVFNTAEIPDCIVSNQFFKGISGNSIAVSTFLKVENIRKMLVLPGLSEAKLAICDVEGRVLFSDIADYYPQGGEKSGERDFIGGLSYHIWQSALPDSSMKLTIMIPNAVFMQNSAKISRFLILLLTILMLMILFALVYMCLSVIRPLIPIINMLSSDENKHKNFFSLIREAYEKQLNVTQEYKENNNLVYSQMRSAALRHALRGDHLNREEYRILSELEALGGRFVVVIFRLFSISDSQMENLETYGLMFFGSQWHNGTVYNNKNEYFAVLPANMFLGEDAIDIRDKFTKICGTYVIMGWSEAHLGIEALPDATMEARAYLQKMFENGKQGDVLQTDIDFGIFHMLEKSLEHGDRSNVSEILSTIKKSMNSHSLDPDYCKGILYDLNRLLLNKTGQCLSKSALIESSFDCVPDEIVQIMLRHCDSLNDQKAENHNNLAQHIVEYINNHISDPELCLTSLAEHFQLSPNYISMLIKKQTKQNYTIYITDLRMKLAMKLLTETNRDIDSIIRETGYYHKNTFYKVFKKTFDNPPNYYRSE